MALFIVMASERVFYEVEVEAKDRAELDTLLREGDVSWGDAVDGQDFSVDFIEEQSDDANA
jgi:hypothetical protein